MPIYTHAHTCKCTHTYTYTCMHRNTDKCTLTVEELSIFWLSPYSWCLQPGFLL